MTQQSEQGIQNRIRLDLSRGPTRLFRNNTGALKDEGGRLVHFGLCKGSSDLIGWKTKTITQDMVGSKVAIFTAIEVKKPKKNATDLQDHFIKVVNAAGGIAGVAHSSEAAKRLLYGRNTHLLT
tara:strand:+ start:2976 stop:3347 length:372 start_codon:yes stop_codon:yes gene_type:complete